MRLLTDDADVATWNNQGLPSDRMSTENATILCHTERWPLIVDAQLQGIKWIKNKYKNELKAIRLGQKRCLMVTTLWGVGGSKGSHWLCREMHLRRDLLNDGRIFKYNSWPTRRFIF